MLVNSRYSITFLLLIGVGLHCYSQNNPEDFNIWSGISVKTKLMKKVQGSAELQNRLDENATQVHANLIEMGIKYKGLKKIDIYSNYRFSNKEDKTSNRIDLRASWDEKIIKRTYLKLTVKSQFDKDSDQKYWDSQLRFKWEIEHKIKKQKIYPYFSNEWFYDLSDAGSYFKAIRFSTGIGFEISDMQSFDIGFTRAIELNKSFPENRNILGFAYKFNL